MSSVYTYIMPLAGGLMIGSSVYHLLACDGSVLGASGFVHSTVRYLVRDFPSKPDEGTRWKLSFVAGSAAAAGLLHVGKDLLAQRLGLTTFEALPGSWIMAAVSGLLVGVGTKLGSGCTSGHMICGMSRLSPRSIVATCIFFPTAILVSNCASTIPVPPTELPPPALGLALPVLAALQLPLVVYRTTRSRTVSAFAIGAHFSLGLALSGMLRPSAVLGFMALPLPFPPFTNSPWDPSLLMVVVGALIPNMLAWQFHIKKMPKPERANSFSLPTRRDIDADLVVGALLFGVGWGLCGICPGPGLVSWFASPTSHQLLAWMAGMSVGGSFESWLSGVIA